MSYTIEVRTTWFDRQRWIRALLYRWLGWYTCPICEGMLDALREQLYCPSCLNHEARDL